MTTRIHSLSPTTTQSEIQIPYHEYASNILENDELNRDQKVEELCRVKPSDIYELRYVITTHQGDELFDPKFVRHCVDALPHTKASIVSSIFSQIATRENGGEFCLQIYETLKERFNFSEWCVLFVDKAKQRDLLMHPRFLDDLNEETVQAFSWSQIYDLMRACGKEFTTRVCLLLPLPDFGKMEAMFKSLIEYDLREVFEHFLNEGVIGTKEIFLSELLFPESWYEEPSFQEAWKASCAQKLTEFFAKKSEKSKISEFRLLEPLSFALGAGRLDLAEQVLALSKKSTLTFFSLEHLDYALTFGEISSLDWAVEKEFIQKSDLENIVRHLSLFFKRKVSPVSTEFLKALMERGYLNPEKHKVAILQNLICHHTLDHLEVLFDWRDVTEEEWEEVFSSNYVEPKALFLHLFSKNSEQEVRELLQLFSDEQLEKMFCKYGFFTGMDSKLISLFVERYLGYDFHAAVDFVDGWQTKMSKSTLFEWKSENIASILMSVKRDLGSKELQRIKEADNWTPEVILSWASLVEEVWISEGTSICRRLLDKLSTEMAFSDLNDDDDFHFELSAADGQLYAILKKLPEEVLKRILHSPTVCSSLMSHLNLVILLLESDSLELERLTDTPPLDWRTDPRFRSVASKNCLPQIQEAAGQTHTPEEASKWMQMALLRGHCDLALAIYEKNPDLEPLSTEFIDRCLNYQQYESLLFIESYQLNRKAKVASSNYGTWKLILAIPDPSTRLTVLDLYAKSGVNLPGVVHRSSALSELINAVLLNDRNKALFLVEHTALHVNDYGNDNLLETDNGKKYLAILDEASDEILRDILLRAPKTWLQFLLQDSGASLATNHDRALQIALEVRLGLQPEEAVKYMNKVDKEIRFLPEGGKVRVAYYRALFLTLNDPELPRRLFDVLRFLSGENAEVQEEFFYHLFTKFRPEIIASDSKLRALLSCWSVIQNDEEKALFFNALQVQHPIWRVRDAILGRRNFQVPEEGQDLKLTLQKLAYIEVATYQEGIDVALSAYHSSHQELQIPAIRALTSLAVPLPEETVRLLKESFYADTTPLKHKEALMHLFWAMSRNPDDKDLKEMFLSNPEVGLDLIGYLNYKPEEIERVIPQLLELSHSDDRKLRVRAAFTLSRLPNEKALLRALEIIQCSDWEAYDEDFRFEEHGHQGHWLMFLKRPTFQNSRSSMVTRILDHLAEVRREDLKEDVAEKMRAFVVDPEAFPTLKAQRNTVIHPPHSTRYFDKPIYFPKGALFRGLGYRKGENQFYEAVRDLMRHGSYRANLSHYGTKYDNNTWGKIGHSFVTHSKEGAKHYATGATIALDSSYYNREYMKGFARLEEESSLNNLFYRGIPWAVIRRINLDESLKKPIQALWKGEDLPESKLFEGLSQKEIDNFKANLQRQLPDGSTVYEKLTFDLEIDEKEISVERVAMKTVKRHIQREAARKLYQEEVIMQDEILEHGRDEEYAKYIPRMIDLFKPGTTNPKSPNTRGLPTRLKVIARLAALFQDGDLSKLEEKQALHGLSLSGMHLVKALVKGFHYKSAIKEYQCLPCHEGEYQAISSQLYGDSHQIRD